MLDDQISCMGPDCRVVLLEQFRLAEPLEVHSLRSLSVPSFSFLGHDSFLIYGRRTTERTNRRTENEAPSLPPFLPSFTPLLQNCLVARLVAWVMISPAFLSLSPLRCPKAFQTRCVRSLIWSRNLYSIILCTPAFLST